MSGSWLLPNPRIRSALGSGMGRLSAPSGTTTRRRRFLELLIAGLALAGVGFTLYYFVERTRALDELAAHDQRLLYKLNQEFGRVTEHILSDVFIIAGGVREGAPWSGDPGVKGGLASFFMTVSQRTRLYQKIRYLDVAGVETIRVDFAEGAARVVAPDHLEDLGKQAFFLEASELKDGHVYVSRFVVGAEGVVLRFATPIADDIGVRRGVVVLDLRAKVALRGVRAQAPLFLGRLEMLDDRGGRLFGPREDHPWDVIVDQEAFAIEHPEAWDDLRDTEAASFMLDGELYTFSTLQLLERDPTSGAEGDTERSALAERLVPPRAWKLVSVVSDDLVSVSVGNRTRAGVVIFVLFCLLWALVSHVGAGLLTERVVTKLRLQLLSQVVEQSRDLMFITDAEGYFLYVNQAFEGRTGYTQADLRGKTTQILNSGKHDAAFYAKLWRTIKEGSAFEAVFVNRAKDGTHFYSDKVIAGLRDDHGRIASFVSTGRDVTQERALGQRVKQLVKMALHDPLTGIENRVLLEDRVRSALSRVGRLSRGLAIMAIDLDGFKEVNDTWGHKTGDELLVAFVKRILVFKRKADAFIRLGGDEFLLVLENVGERQAIDIVSELVLKAGSQPFRLPSGPEVSISCSVGVAYSTTGDVEPAKLIERADELLYRSKNTGKNRSTVEPADAGSLRAT